MVGQISGIIGRKLAVVLEPQDLVQSGMQGNPVRGWVKSCNMDSPMNGNWAPQVCARPAPFYFVRNRYFRPKARRRKLPSETPAMVHLSYS